MISIPSIIKPKPIAQTHGYLSMVFDLPTGNTTTRLARCEHRPPLQIVRAFKQADGAALVHLHNVSGGVLSGDQLETRIEVGPNARVQITTTSANRLYRRRGPAGNGTGSATQCFDVRVEAGGLLEYVPDATIPFADARAKQHTQISLDDDAGLFWWDVISPGREARGERFAYERLEFKTCIEAGGIPIAIEHAILEPAQARWNPAVRLGGFGYYATFYICKVGTSAEALEAHLLPLTRQLSESGTAWWGVSSLPAHGVAVRGLAHTTRAAMAGLAQVWQAAKALLYGRDAIAPRKTY